MTFEFAHEVLRQLDDYKDYYKDGELHGVMGSILTPMTRTVYSMSKDNRFTVAMLRDLIRYRADKSRDLCLVTDEVSEFERLRTLLEQRYNFTCVIEDDVIDGKPIMYSFYLIEELSYGY